MNLKTIPFDPIFKYDFLKQKTEDGGKEPFKQIRKLLRTKAQAFPN